eukprot:scpid28293/ scgid33705/ Protein FAN; Factor associated with neutral sphingomyelinase activation
MAFARRQTQSNQERFSLLLLDPGEIYFEDFSVFYYPIGLDLEEAYERRQRGHLKVCSNSILFDPQDTSYPILRFLFRDCRGVTRWTPPLMSKLGQEGDVLSIDSKQVIEMKEGNVIGPYTFKKVVAEFRFALNYVSSSDVLPQITQLYRASTLPTAEQNMMVQSIVRSRQARVTFNTGCLDSLYEKIVLETTGDRITPLVCNPGRIMLTNSRLYFQPFNNADPVPVHKVKLSDISRVIKRRYLLQHVGIEIYSSDGFHIYLVFGTEAERNMFYKELLAQPDISLEDTEQENLTLKWQNGVISNYDYLMYLNSMADRSFNDLTQYPVFPWVIADYASKQLDLGNPATFRDLSKPIGAMTESRLEQFKERYKEMPEPKFLYGSHYSTPGYVLFYLVRIAPEYMLCLQNGRFDQADRLFNHIGETWTNCLCGNADVKELIPEFYSLPSDFMFNTQNLDFGSRQDRTKVDDVLLPPWAKDGDDFIRKMREALECEYVSQHIHEWIDLIFGYQQRGEEAVKADNLFYYLTYEGAVDLASITDPNERASLEVQITEFGQTPKQLFTSPHPARKTVSTPQDIKTALRLSSHLSTELAHSPTITRHSMMTKSQAAATSEELTRDETDGSERDSSVSGWNRVEQLKCVRTEKLHRDVITGLKLSADCKSVFSVSQDCTLKVYSIEDQQQLRSINLSAMALSSLAVMPDDKTVVVGSWDNNVYVYSVEYGHTLCTSTAHDDAVSSLCWNNERLVTSSWDSTVKVWNFGMKSGSRRPAPPELLAELDHDTQVSCVDINPSTTLVVSGMTDGAMNIWDLENDNALLHQLPLHMDTVNCVKFSPDGQRLLSCSADNYMRVIDVNTATEIYAKDTKENLKCAAWNGDIILAGSESGGLFVWDLIRGSPLAVLNIHKGAVTSIVASPDGNVVITGGEDRTIAMWRS